MKKSSVVSTLNDKKDGSLKIITKVEDSDQYSTKQYHPTAEQLKVRKARHRRTGSHGSGNFTHLQGNSPRISPLRERRVSLLFCPNLVVKFFN